MCLSALIISLNWETFLLSLRWDVIGELYFFVFVFDQPMEPTIETSVCGLTGLISRIPSFRNSLTFKVLPLLLFN